MTLENMENLTLNDFFSPVGLENPTYVRNKVEFENVTRNMYGNKYDKLLEYLSKSDFYYAPAASKFHDNYPGGLYDHCKLLYQELLRTSSMIRNAWNKESLFLIAFCHDLCKIGLYKPEIVTTESGKKFVQYGYNNLGYDDRISHGTKSLEIVGDIIPEYLDELIANCIVYHMGSYTKDAPGWSEVIKGNDLIFFTHAADMVASRSGKVIQSVEVGDNNKLIIT
jgi:hypothetical protein